MEEDKNRKRGLRRHQNVKRKVKAFKIFVSRKKLGIKISFVWADELFPGLDFVTKSRYPTIGKYLKNDGKNCFARRHCRCDWCLNSKLHQAHKQEDYLETDYKLWNEDQELS